MTKEQITVAITGLNNIDNPGPGIPVIRGLRKSKSFKVKIIGLAYENLEPGIYMHKLVDKSYQIPYPSAGSEAILKRLNYINGIEKIDVLIPNFDAELYTFIRSSQKLGRMGIKTFLPTYNQLEERSKPFLYEFGKKYDVLVPYSRSIFNEKDISTLSKDFQYPVLVKGKFYDAYIAHTPEQALIYFRRISAKWGVPIIIQQFVQGTEVNVVALGDGKGNTIGAVPMRKLYITDKGKAWSGITIDDERLLKLTQEIIRKTEWRGGMELEIIKSKNKYHLLEINPRLPAWVYLAVAAGQNLPEALVKLALGIEVKPIQKYEVGKLFIRYSYEMVTELEEFEKLTQFGEL